jgi:hypothetical protein
MWQALAAGAALGLAKNALVDKPKEEKQRALAAQTALYSPWTGMKPNEVQQADPFGNALQGATAGAMFSQASQNQDMQNQMMEMRKQQMGASPQPNLYGGNASAVPMGGSPYSFMA